MQHKLFNSKFKSSVGRSPLLDIIGDSPLGENPHRAVAMGLIFERTVHDCRERLLVQAKKSSQATPVNQSDNCGKTTSAPTTTTQPTTTQPPPPTKRPLLRRLQSIEEQTSKIERAAMQPSQPPPTTMTPLKAAAQPPTFLTTPSLFDVDPPKPPSTPAMLTFFPRTIKDPYRK